MDAEQREGVCVVLVRARNPNNIGAVARAMHGFGFADLRLVNDYPVALERARSAVDASAILAGARTFSTVAEAVADCRLVVGTTAVGERKQEHSLFTLAEARGQMQGAGRVALLFGSEKTGLSNEALSHCHWLLTIPMHATPEMRHASMNLGQAAAVCLYELIREGSHTAPTRESIPAVAADLERLTLLWAGSAGKDRLCAPQASRRRACGSSAHGVKDATKPVGCSEVDRRPASIAVAAQR